MSAELALDKMTISEAGHDALRVEISTANRPDTDETQESLCFSVLIDRGAFPLLVDEVRLAALQRVRALIDPRIASLQVTTRKAR